jgi:uncharacterized protein YndB with AHSA1/START domain
MIEASTDAVVHEAEYPHPIELVWKALTDREAISSWLMQTDFEPEVGRKFTFTDPNAGEGWSGIVECEVLELDEPKRLSYSWVSGFPTTVTFALEATADGATRVRVQQAGFDTAGDFGKQARQGADYFWGQKTLRGSLPEALASLAKA